MNDLIFSLTLLIVLAISIRLVYVFFLQTRLQLTFADAPARSLLYFALASCVLVLVFPLETRVLTSGITSLGYVLVLFAVLVVFPLVYRLLRKKMGAPQWLYASFPTQTMLTLEESYIVAKVGDVLSQQLAGGIFILLLHGAGVAYPVIVFSFIALFLASHFYLFFTSGFIWGLYYTGLSLGGAFAIPFLVLFIPGGVAWAFLLHMMFYVLAGAFFAKLPRPKEAVCYDILGIPPSQES